MITLANVTLYTMESNPNSTMGVWASVPPCHAAIPDLSQVQLGPVLVLSLCLQFHAESAPNDARSSNGQLNHILGRGMQDG